MLPVSETRCDEEVSATQRCRELLVVRPCQWLLSRFLPGAHIGSGFDKRGGASDSKTPFTGGDVRVWVATFPSFPSDSLSENGLL